MKFYESPSSESRLLYADKQDRQSDGRMRRSSYCSCFMQIAVQRA